MYANTEVDKILGILMIPQQAGWRTEKNCKGTPGE